jgi:hypothetical protein
MATPMDPRAPMPQGTEVAYTSQGLHLRRAAEMAGRRMASAAPVRKPPRPKKERLPVATEVDPLQVRNPGESLGPGRATRRAAPPGPAAPPRPSPAPVITFDGVVDNRTTVPPDTAGAVGIDHLFNPLNNRIQVFDRSGASLFDLPLDDFWQEAGPVDAFDPKVVYDRSRDRFVFVSMANAQSRSSALLVAVSATGDPTGDWSSVLVPIDPLGPGQQGIWLDYPSLGFSADKVTVQVNLYTLAGNRFAGSNIYVWDKDQLFADTDTAAVRLFHLPDQGGTQVPAMTSEPGQRDQFLVSRWSSNADGSGFYAVYRLTGSVAAGSAALNREGFIQTSGMTWDSFSPSGDFAPQRGTARRIDTGDDRILSVVFRNGSLWFSHTVYLPAGGPNRTAAQWLEVDAGSFQIRQLERIDDPSGRELFAFPTLAVNSSGHVLIGMSQFAADRFASAAYALHAPGQTHAPHVYQAGLNRYFETSGGTDNRWGDYSATQVDPTDDRQFWTIQEYAAADENSWATRWALVRV